MSEDAAVYHVDGRAVSLQPCGDGRDWARRLLALYRQGLVRNPTLVRFAHEGLGLPVPRAKGQR